MVEGQVRGPVAETDAQTFEAAMAELERIVRQLETGELGLDAALGLYERGVALVRRCRGELERAEARLQVLSVDPDGQPVLRPLDAPES